MHTKSERKGTKELEGMVEMNKETEIVEKFITKTKARNPNALPKNVNAENLKAWIDYELIDCDPYEIVALTTNLAVRALEYVDWNYLVEKFKEAN